MPFCLPMHLDSASAYGGLSGAEPPYQKHLVYLPHRSDRKLSSAVNTSLGSRARTAPGNIAERCACSVVYIYTICKARAHFR